MLEIQYEKNQILFIKCYCEHKWDDEGNVERDANTTSMWTQIGF